MEEPTRGSRRTLRCRSGGCTWTNLRLVIVTGLTEHIPEENYGNSNM